MGSSLFSLQNLRWLNLAGNDLGISEIPSEFGKLRSLTYLNLSGAGFTGFVPPEISLLSDLVSLDLSLNYGLFFRNHDFNMLVHNLTKLENIVLRGMSLSLVVPYSFLNLTVSLKHLSLSYCDLQGNFPTQVFHLPYLENIILRSNPNLTGYLPETNWSSPLSLLDVSRTRFPKGLPGSIGNLKHLKALSLSSCVFMGSIPSTLGNLTKLTFLDISDNMFQGQIPDVFGNLNDLSSMDFSSNNFSGVFPSSAFNLTSLTFMDFSFNFLQGTLPNNISGLSYLRKLYLYANLLSGRVPGWLFSLPSLEYLDLHSNKLTLCLVRRITQSITPRLRAYYITPLFRRLVRCNRWVANTLDFNKTYDASVFETTIRSVPIHVKVLGSTITICPRVFLIVVGGLLSTYDLSGDNIFLEKARDIADRLLPAWDTPSGIPYNIINLARGNAHNPGWTGQGGWVLVLCLQQHFEDMMDHILVRVDLCRSIYLSDSYT
ncbi:hypothetical protein GOBAR_AA01873 [Gossypium barbadense]|uniref:alpha-1,2-Mannosidase n=1 Tax=Gossypium barbadense TaxID=3634 RepID=A0A2P5YSX8_GOSBA|nr:hypothetical protein GOBAR_AA01873 [Gossypium barbadense]